jgi:hypothetical protein
VREKETLSTRSQTCGSRQFRRNQIWMRSILTSWCSWRYIESINTGQIPRRHAWINYI